MLRPVHNKEALLFCSYIPGEIFHAAKVKATRFHNAIPEGSGAITPVPAYMCSVVSNSYTYIDEHKDTIGGIILTNACHGMTMLYEIISVQYPGIPLYLMNVPRNNSVNAEMFFKKEISKLIDFVNKTFNVHIGMSDLDNAIQCSNQKHLMKEKVYEFLSDSNNSLCAEDYKLLNRLYLNNEKFIHKANELILQNTKDHSVKGDGPRIMISGSLYNPANLMSRVQEYGGRIVYADNCNFFGKTVNTIDIYKEPLEALTCAYLNKPACARYDNTQKLCQDFEEALQRFKVDAVIFSIIKFCPDQSYRSLSMIDILKKYKIPYLLINSEFKSDCNGQLDTRIQAFLEQLTEVYSC